MGLINGNILPPYLLTDESLVGTWLCTKINHPNACLPMMKEVDFYKENPWTLIDQYPLEEWTAANHAYFLSHPYRGVKGPFRCAQYGFWYMVGDDNVVENVGDDQCQRGMKRLMEFYEGDVGRSAIETNWVAEEFRSITENGDMVGDWVLYKLTELK